MRTTLLVGLCLSLLSACSDSSDDASDQANSAAGAGAAGAAGAAGGAGGAEGGAAGGAGEAASHAIVINLALAADADGKNITIGTQNGSTVQVAVADIVGKPIYWVTNAGGDPPGNAQPVDQGVSAVGADLKATFTTPAHYTDGPWELALLIAVSGKVPTSQPNPGDLAAFDLATPPAGEPPVTGQTVRVSVHGSDKSVTLDNHHFIRFGAK